MNIKTGELETIENAAFYLIRIEKGVKPAHDRFVMLQYITRKTLSGLDRSPNWEDFYPSRQTVEIMMPETDENWDEKQMKDAINATFKMSDHCIKTLRSQ